MPCWWKWTIRDIKVGKAPCWKSHLFFGCACRSRHCFPLKGRSCSANVSDIHTRKLHIGESRWAPLSLMGERHAVQVMAEQDSDELLLRGLNSDTSLRRWFRGSFWQCYLTPEYSYCSYPTTATLNANHSMISCADKSSSFEG